MNSSKSYNWLPDLIKATVKSNIIVLTYNPECLKSQTKIDPKFYETIKITDFIHKVYIECARELWNNPYLMYHTYPALELKRNQRDTIHLIKDAIKEGIRKLLPVKEILELYLGEKLETNLQNDQFEKNVTEADEKNIQKFIRKEFEPQIITPEINKPEVIKSQIIMPEMKKLDYIEPNIEPIINELIKQDNIESKMPSKSVPQTGGNDLEAKILEIINKDTDATSSYMSPKRKNSTDETPIKRNSFKNLKQENKHEAQTIDDKIKNLLEKNLGETDLNTSLSYRPETNEKEYQEIFSNNAQNGAEIKNASVVNDSSKSKRKFFNNYLNF